MPVNHLDDYVDGVLRADVSSLAVRLQLVLTNTGERHAGPTSIEIRMPLAVRDESSSYREGHEHVLTRRLERVALEVPEELALNLRGDMPRQGVETWPITILVRAEDAEPVPLHIHELQVGRYHPLPPE